MLFLRTGLPGAGKTLNTIKEIDEEHQPDPSDSGTRLNKESDFPDLPPRTIYYHGIPDLKVDQLKSSWVEWDKPDEWFNLPDGAVIVIDEAQGTFGTDIGRTRIEKVTRFEKHRHHGWDIHLITQHPSLIAPPVRKLVGKHINFIRPYGRTKGVFRHEYEMCVDSPEKRTNFKMAQESKIEFDKSYFGLYKSATIHTHKKVTPTFVKLIPLLALAVVTPLALLGYGFYWVYADAKAEQYTVTDSVVEAESRGQAVSVPRTGHRVTSGGVSTAEYIQQLQPRVSDLSLSAARYDALNKARDFPRPYCISTSGPQLVSVAESRGFKTSFVNGVETICQCYTQQATRLNTSSEFCLDVVRNGYFDDTQLQPQYATANSPRGLTSSPSKGPADVIRRVPAAVSQRLAKPVASDVVVIKDNVYAERPWRTK